jgi:hypothetical protein
MADHSANDLFVELGGEHQIRDGPLRTPYGPGTFAGGSKPSTRVASSLRSTLKLSCFAWARKRLARLKVFLHKDLFHVSKSNTRVEIRDSHLGFLIPDCTMMRRIFGRLELSKLTIPQFILAVVTAGEPDSGKCQQRSVTSARLFRHYSRLGGTYSCA